MVVMKDDVSYNQLREAIHYKWDPIGVMDYSSEMGEYDSYIPALYDLLKKGATQKEIFDYLWAVETDSIGLEGDREITEKFSVWLFDFSSSLG